MLFSLFARRIMNEIHRLNHISIPTFSRGNNEATIKKLNDDLDSVGGVNRYQEVSIKIF